MPDESIQSAARKFASLVAPDITRVVCHGPHGKSVTISIPPNEKAVDLSPVTIPAPLASRGWDFSHPTPRFDGTVVPIHGRKLDLLKVLAESPIPLQIAGLKPAWKDYDAEDGTVRWFIGDLRRALASLFTDLEEPIRNDESGYWLTIR